MFLFQYKFHLEEDYPEQYDELNIIINELASMHYEPDKFLSHNFDIYKEILSFRLIKKFIDSSVKNYNLAGNCVAMPLKLSVYLYANRYMTYQDYDLAISLFKFYNEPINLRPGDCVKKEAELSDASRVHVFVKNNHAAALMLNQMSENASDLLTGQFRIDSSLKANVTELLDSVMTNHPDYGNALYNRAVLNYLTRDYAGARSDFERYFVHLKSKRSDDVNARINYGIFLVDQGQIMQAVEQFEYAVQADPGSAAAHYNLALGMVKSNADNRSNYAYETILSHYNKALESNLSKDGYSPFSTDVKDRLASRDLSLIYFRRAILHLMNEHYEDAMVDLYIFESFNRPLYLPPGLYTEACFKLAPKEKEKLIALKLMDSDTKFATSSTISPLKYRLFHQKKALGFDETTYQRLMKLVDIDAIRKPRTPLTALSRRVKEQSSEIAEIKDLREDSERALKVIQKVGETHTSDIESLKAELSALRKLVISRNEFLELKKEYETLSQEFRQYKEGIEQALKGVRDEFQDVFANGVSTSTRLAPNVRVVYDKHRRGYAAMRQTLGFKLLHAVSTPARLLSDAFGSKRPVVMTQSSDSLSLTLPEASADTVSSSQVDEKSATRLMPNLSFEATYYTQPDLPFDAGAWDPQIDQHPETGAPIFTYSVFEHGEEVGSARFYQHPMLCRSKTGNRHNVLELTGVLDRLDTDTMAAQTDEICASLPPTLIERLGESATRGVKWGAWRGVTGVVEHGMKRRGYSSKVSKWVTQGVFYGGLFVGNVYQRVSIKQAQGQALTDEDMLSATTEALVDTGTVFASQQLLSKAGQALHATGQGLTRKGWTKTGGALQTLSGWLGYGMYGAMAYRQGFGQALAQVTGGAASEALMTHAGTAVVDRVLPEYESPLTQAANCFAGVASLEGHPAEPRRGDEDESLLSGKEEADTGAGMGLGDL